MNQPNNRARVPTLSDFEVGGSGPVTINPAGSPVAAPAPPAAPPMPPVVVRQPPDSSEALERAAREFERAVPEGRLRQVLQPPEPTRRDFDPDVSQLVNEIQHSFWQGRREKKDPPPLQGKLLDRLLKGERWGERHGKAAIYLARATLGRATPPNIFSLDEELLADVPLIERWRTRRLGNKILYWIERADWLKAYAPNHRSGLRRRTNLQRAHALERKVSRSIEGSPLYRFADRVGRIAERIADRVIDRPRAFGRRLVARIQPRIDRNNRELPYDRADLKDKTDALADQLEQGAEEKRQEKIDRRDYRRYMREVRRAGRATRGANRARPNDRRQ